MSYKQSECNPVRKVMASPHRCLSLSEETRRPCTARVPVVLEKGEQTQSFQSSSKKSPFRGLRLKELDVKLCGKRCPASAAAGGIRIFERKARPHHVGGVVDSYTVQILGREHIDKKSDALFVQNEIARF